jgi:hypothetical protein
MNKVTALLVAGGLCLLGDAALASPLARAAEAFAGCRELPAGKPVLKLKLRPGSKLPDLIAYVSTVSCTPFVVPAEVDVDKTFTLPEADGRLLSKEQVYDLFLAVLDSNGLTVQRMEKVLRIVPAR